MDKRWLVVIAIIVLTGLWWISENPGDVMPYRGEEIKLSKTYANFDEYKNDPNNIHASETARVQRLVMEAPIAHLFENRLDVFRATQEIVFPGYGAGSGGGPQPDGSELFAVVIEIPRAEKDRLIVFGGRNGRYELLDDFVREEISYPFGIREENGSYIFYDRDGKELFRRPATRR